MFARITSKDVPENPGKPKIWENSMARAFLNGMHYGVHADVGRAVGVSDSCCLFETASVCPAECFDTFFHAVLSGYFYVLGASSFRPP